MTMTQNNTDNGSIELTEQQRERLDRIKSECAGDTPEPTDEQIMNSLMDTWDAVGDGYYTEGDRTQPEP